MIAREAQDRIYALLFSAHLELERVLDMARRFAVETSALVSIGPRPSRKVVAALAHHGARWHLWDSPSDESIRFVLSNVLFEQCHRDGRVHRRVPLHHAAQLEVDGAKGDLTIRDLSLGGACLLGSVIGDEGDRGILHFAKGEDQIDLPMRIAWAAGQREDHLRVAGVTFLEVTLPAGEAIAGLMESVIAKHRIASNF